MTRRLAGPFVAALVISSLVAPVSARTFSDPAAAGFSPQVPISAFARPASWFDPSRLHLTSTVTVGSGWGGQTSALQVTRLQYSFGAPVTMGVSVGNTFGPARAGNGSTFFLEGLDLTWRPNANSVFRIEMHDVRSPLQQPGYIRGYGDPFTSPY